MSTILITGGTGLIGKALSEALLKKGYTVIVLSRKISSMKPLPGGIQYRRWNVEQHTIDADAFSQADYIIHLAGEGVADKRWTEIRKQQIVDSRVNSSQLIVESLNAFPNKVKAVISASAIGWYGADLAIPNLNSFEENHVADIGFLGDACRKWEESIDPVSLYGIRLVKLRTGIVLSKEGGALKKFLQPLSFGIAPVLGKGRQIISWIHIDDLVNLYMYAIENEKMKGVYNAVAPAPVSNKEFMLTVARIKRGNFFIPLHIPSVLLKIVMGEMSVEVLKSATVSSRKIQDAGFYFKYHNIQEALNNLLR